jgi:hypothetical protein
MDAYAWPLADAFRGREDALARLEDWWQGDERMPIALYGRRRVGKSWLFRRFAHGKPAIVLVAEQLAPGAQLSTASPAGSNPRSGSGRTSPTCPSCSGSCSASRGPGGCWSSSTSSGG